MKSSRVKLSILPIYGQPIVLATKTMYQDTLLAGARAIASHARKMAAERGIQLTAIKWHRGHEVADLDNYWLVIELGNRPISRHFPSGWVVEAGKGHLTEQTVACLSEMLGAIAGSRPQQTKGERAES